MNNTKQGNIGENLACEFLIKQGYQILERNFRIRGGELDIIAKEGNTLVYVEVKTRSSNKYGTPEESVSAKKIEFLKRAAKFYRLKNSNLPLLERIDVVAIMLSQNPQIKLIKNITL